MEDQSPTALLMDTFLLPSHPPAQPPPTTMPPGALFGWKAKLSNSNTNAICTSAMGAVKKLTIGGLLRSNLVIPVFQRRYCWSAPQWTTLLTDCLRCANMHATNHPLGRLTCYITGGTTVVIDGQQRCTTCVILASVVRDIAFERGLLVVAEKIQRGFVGDQKGMEEWCKDRDTTRSGEALPFLTLSPTYHDRAAIGALMLPREYKVKDGGGWSRIYEAREWLYKQVTLKCGSDDLLRSLADVIFNRLTWLYFPITVDPDVDDGTGDLSVVFERLALRDGMFCKPPRKGEYCNLGAADFIRNMVLGSFEEGVGVALFEEYWLPMEEWAGSAAREEEGGGAGMAVVLETMFKAFLKDVKQRKLNGMEEVEQKFLGGAVYTQFKDYLGLRASGDMQGALVELSSFSKEYFASGAWRRDVKELLVEPSVPSVPNVPSVLQNVGHWTCSRCNYRNLAGWAACTACSLAAP